MEDHVRSLRGKSVVLAGCGGGCDVFGTVPYWHALKGVASRVVLLSLTFTQRRLLDAKAKRVTARASAAPPGASAADPSPTTPAPAFHGLYEVLPGAYTPPPKEYFPEQNLANHLGVPVYALLKESTPRTLADAYVDLFEHCAFPAPPGAGVAGATEGRAGVSVAADGTVAPQCVMLVDGGCDVLLCGDERGLATPVEDMMQLRAVEDLLPVAWHARHPPTLPGASG